MDYRILSLIVILVICLIVIIIWQLKYFLKETPLFEANTNIIIPLINGGYVKYNNFRIDFYDNNKNLQVAFPLASYACKAFSTAQYLNRTEILFKRKDSKGYVQFIVNSTYICYYLLTNDMVEVPGTKVTYYKEIKNDT